VLESQDGIDEKSTQIIKLVQDSNKSYSAVVNLLYLDALLQAKQILFSVLLLFLLNFSFFLSFFLFFFDSRKSLKISKVTLWWPPAFCR